MNQRAATESGFEEPPVDDAHGEARREAFYSSRNTRLGPEIVSRVARLSTEPRHDVVLFGPSGAGKTALVSSFGQACEAVDPREFQALPMDALADLAGQAGSYRFHQTKWPPTRDPVTYSLQVKLGEEDFVMKLLDGPGGQFLPFSAERWDDLGPDERFALEASCAVFCIDAIDPQPDLWRASLPPLVARLASHDGDLIPRLSSPRPPRDTDFPRLRTPKKQLPFDRALIALTRTDPLIEEALRAYGAARENSRHRLSRGMSAEALALQIDPIRLLDDLVGTIRGLLRSALKPTAELAVGLTSAWGLLPQEPLRWSPFGVREALLFLATGQCRGPVACVGSESALETNIDGWTELSSALSLDELTTGDSQGDKR